MKIYDIVIIGSGPAGCFAAKEFLSTGLKVLMVEKGKALSKRKDLVSGWFGQGIVCLNRFETKDSMFNVCEVKEALDYLSKISDQRIIKKNKYCNLSYDTGIEIARHFYNLISKEIDVSFDTEVSDIIKEGGFFRVKFYNGKEVFCRKCLISSGKYSVEWIKNISNSFHIKPFSHGAKIGFRLELQTSKIKSILDENEDLVWFENNLFYGNLRINSGVCEWNESNIISSFGCSSQEHSKKSNLMIGVSDSLDNCIRNIQIINVLNNDKIKKEQLKDFMAGRSLLHNLEYFNCLREVINKLSEKIPDLIDCSVIYIPEIRMKGILSVDKEMKTPIVGLYGAGECTSRIGNNIGAMASGIVAARNIIKEFVKKDE